MTDRTVEFQEPVTFLGGGRADSGLLRTILKRAPRLIAVDGGANMAVSEGLSPDLVIGDFDSVTEETLAAIPLDRQMRIAEQETTDFEKCLLRVRAPLILGLGFTGARVDHSLSVMSAMVRHTGKPCIILDETDLIFAAPPRLALDLAAGTRLSLFPMATIEGRSSGLRWPIDGLTLAPDGRIGTSNEATGPVDLAFARTGMLIVLPAGQLTQAITGLLSAHGLR
jgi:thiamine pyrophosphokinase